MSGELKDRPFGYIKACRLPTQEIVLHLHIFCMDFQEFGEIMSTLNDYTQYKKLKKNEQEQKSQ